MRGRVHAAQTRPIRLNLAPPEGHARIFVSVESQNGGLLRLITFAPGYLREICTARHNADALKQRFSVQNFERCPQSFDPETRQGFDKITLPFFVENVENMLKC